MSSAEKAAVVAKRRVPVDWYLYKPDDHKPLDDEGVRWLADQLCSESRVHPDRTMSAGWIPHQAAYELPHLVDQNEALRARVKELEGALEPLAFLDLGADEDEGAPFTTQEVWETIRRDRILDCFDFNDIEAARQALKGDKQS